MDHYHSPGTLVSGLLVLAFCRCSSQATVGCPRWHERSDSFDRWVINDHVRRPMRQYVIITQGVLPPGEPGHLPGHDGHGAPLPRGLVLERGLGRVTGQHRQ